MTFSGADTSYVGAADKAKIYSKFTMYTTQVQFPDY